MRRLWVWLNERWPLDRVLYWSLDEPIVGGASFWYTLGSATLIVFALQVVSGVWQLFYYVPTVDHAYDSLMYLRTQVYFGWLVHGLHYWGASLMVILVVVHMARVFVFGAYKNPRQLTWLSGVGLLLLTLALSLTGAPLPWDERGYWAGEVATSIAGTVPVVGSLAERLLRGGDTMGQLTLSRFFVIHVALLPGLLVALLGLHLLAFRQFGSTGPWSQERRQTSGPFWPDQVFKDAVVGLAVFLGLLFLSAFFPPPIAGPADPTDSTYLPKPEWNFLFLYEALKFFPGKLEPLGTVGLPLVGVLVLTGLPFFDRNPERDPSRRRLAMATGGLAAAAVVALTWAGLMSGQAATSGPPSEPAPAPGAGTTPLGSVAHMSSSARAGMQLFQSLGCVGCHQVNGVGGSVGPGLSGVTLQGKDRNWLMAQIRD
ncbi:MAG TPA: cytochrome b N-terminal domain-containing protein, partial [Candidatus Nitrosotenuis sp.]|nr:cytochrome b N-terminal domain-containing protein [Candidatus Nitrosotenuis sp.]